MWRVSGKMLGVTDGRLQFSKHRVFEPERDIAMMKDTPAAAMLAACRRCDFAWEAGVPPMTPSLAPVLQTGTL